MKGVVYAPIRSVLIPVCFISFVSFIRFVRKVISRRHGASIQSGLISAIIDAFLASFD